MARLTKGLELVSLEGWRPGSHAEFFASVVSFSDSEWSPGSLVILEQCGRGPRVRPSEGGPLYWPALARMLGLAWGSFACVERERAVDGPVILPIEDALIELVEFQPGLHVWGDPGSRPGAARRRQFAMPASGMRNVRVAKPMGPYLAGLLRRAGYDLPDCYLAGEPPERALGTASPPSHG